MLDSLARIAGRGRRTLTTRVASARAVVGRAIHRLRARRLSRRPWLPRRRPVVVAPRTLPGTIALVPVHEDAYTLPFCVRSLAPFVERVVLCLDAPDETTLAVVEQLAQANPNVTVVRSTPPGSRDPAGWVVTRNTLIEAARREFPHLHHVLMVDADDVLSWDAVDDVLVPLLDNPRAVHARLGTFELVGDWVTTARTRSLIWDQNHLYWDAAAVDVSFTPHPETLHEAIHIRDRATGRPVREARSEQVLLHAVLVKPGDQLLRRTFRRAWLLAGRPEPFDAFVIEEAVKRFPRPWQVGVLPSEYVVFHGYQGRKWVIPFRGWERRLPPPVLEHQRAGPRFRMDLATQRRTDLEPPTELDVRLYDALLARDGQRPGGETAGSRSDAID